MPRYRVYEPDTPRDLPLELLQEWDSEIPLTQGERYEQSDGETWLILRIEGDADPGIAGRVHFVRSSLGKAPST